MIKEKDLKIIVITGLRYSVLIIQLSILKILISLTSMMNAKTLLLLDKRLLSWQDN